MTIGLNEEGWIKEKISIQNIDQIKSILNFSIFWNLFEYKYFDKNYKIEKIQKMYLSNLKKFSSVSFHTNELLNYFRSRYVQSMDFTHNFHTLNLRQNDEINLVKDVLMKKNTTDQDSFKVLIIIIGRFRNNFFHGLKSPEEIKDQNRIFSLINFYLSCLIDV